MSTILNIRNLKLAGVSRTALVVGTVVVLAIVGRLNGWNVYKKLTTNTLVAYFPDTLALRSGPLGRACSGACDAPDELVCQCLLKLGILCVAAIFPAGEHRDQCGPEDGVGGVAGVADRELVGGGALVEELLKWRGELRVLRGHEGS
jgi:hypothetical protein